MCQSYPGLRCSRHLQQKIASAEAINSAYPSPENAYALRIARHENSLTQRGMREMYASGEFMRVLNALDEREGRIATAKRFREWAKGVSKDEAKAAARRLERFSPFNLIGIEREWLGEAALLPAFTSRQVRMAYFVAVRAHAGTKRHSGDPYINHPLRVHHSLTERYGHLISEETRIVALLHDAVEDSDLTLSDLRLMGFSERVVSGVDSVTKRDGETYPGAVARAALNRDGRWVKMLDINDNSSPAQLAVFDEIKRLKKKRKYYPAIRFLREVVRSAVDAEAKTA